MEYHGESGNLFQKVYFGSADAKKVVKSLCIIVENCEKHFSGIFGGSFSDLLKWSISNLNINELICWV